MTALAGGRRYAAFFRGEVERLLAYRAVSLSLAGNSLVLVVMYSAFWTAVYGGRQELRGLTLHQMLTYVFVMIAMRRVAQTRMDRYLAERVREGLVAIDFIRPVDVQRALYAQGLGQTAFMALTMGGPLLGLGWLLFRIETPNGALGWALFLIGALLGVLIMLGIDYLFGLVSIFTKGTWGVLQAKANVVNFLAGGVIPLSFFPAWAERLALWLPFPGIVHAPFQLYVGRGQPAALLGHQVFWVAALWALGLWATRRAHLGLEIQGG